MTLSRSTARLSSAPIRVAVANYSGFIVGDDAIFDALICMIRRACGSDVVLDALTAMPERTCSRFQVEHADHIYEFMRSAASRSYVINMITRADLLLIGGGDIIEGQQAILVLIALAVLSGTPVAFVGVGVLPPQGRRLQQYLRWSAHNATYIATRDQESLGLLKQMGVHQPALQVLPDLAVALDPASESAEELLLTEHIAIHRPYVAINVRAPESQQYGTTWGDVEFGALVRICQNIIDNDGMDILCVPFVVSAAQQAIGMETASDDVLLLDLARRIDRAGHVHVSRSDRPPIEVAALLRDAHIAIGMRLHFLVLAASAGTPIVALSYARKVRAFMSSVGLDHLCLDIEALDPTELTARVGQAQVDRDRISAQLTTWRLHAQADLQIIEFKVGELAHQVRHLQAVRQVGARTVARIVARTLAIYSALRRQFV